MGAAPVHAWTLAEAAAAVRGKAVSSRELTQALSRFKAAR